jgi:hypothetical protein
MEKREIVLRLAIVDLVFGYLVRCRDSGSEK